MITAEEINNLVLEYKKFTEKPKRTDDLMVLAELFGYADKIYDMAELIANQAAEIKKLREAALEAQKQLAVDADLLYGSFPYDKTHAEELLEAVLITKTN